MLGVRLFEERKGGLPIAHAHVGQQERRGVHWLAPMQLFQFLQRVSRLHPLTRATMNVGLHHQAPGGFIRAAPLFEVGERFREQSLLDEREGQDLMRLQEVRLHLEHAADLGDGTVVVP